MIKEKKRKKKQKQNTMTISNHIVYVRDWLEFSVALVSLICSIFTLLVIKQMKIWNGNFLLLTTLTVLQVIYDINFLLGISPGFASCVVWNFLDILGGLGVSFTSNIISFTVVYVVRKVKSLNIKENFKYFSVFSIWIPLAFAIVACFGVSPANEDDDKPYTDCIYNTSLAASAVRNFYYWGRLFSIIFNFGAFIYVVLRVRKMGFMSSRNSISSSQTSGEGVIASVISEQQILAVNALASRMKYYPLAQAICRSGSAWNEFNNYQYSNPTSALMAAACAPSSGIFYFIIFLVMQPNAWNTFKGFFGFKVEVKEKHNRNTVTQIFRTSLTDMGEDELEEMINSGSIYGGSMKYNTNSMNANSVKWTENPLPSVMSVDDTYNEVINGGI